MGQRGSRNARLASGILLGPLGNGKFAPVEIQPRRPAMRADQLPLAFQTLEIPPDRFLGDLEPGGQFRRANASFRIEGFQNFAVSFEGKHVVFYLFFLLLFVF
jgi:hypothetical protein